MAASRASARPSKLVSVPLAILKMPSRTSLAAMGSELSVEHGPERAVNGVARRLADTSAARDTLDFEASVSLEDGLRELVEWWEPLRDEIAAGRSLVTS